MTATPAAASPNRERTGEKFNATSRFTEISVREYSSPAQKPRLQHSAAGSANIGMIDATLATRSRKRKPLSSVIRSQSTSTASKDCMSGPKRLMICPVGVRSNQLRGACVTATTRRRCMVLAACHPPHWYMKLFRSCRRMNARTELANVIRYVVPLGEVLSSPVADPVHRDSQNGMEKYAI